MMAGKEHNDLIWLAANWISNRVTGRGMKGNSEISIAPKYVADYVCECSLQYTHYAKYCDNSGLDKGHCCSNIFKGINNEFICVFEAKATRSDFLSTFNGSEKHKNRHKPVGSLHWCVLKKGIYSLDEVPEFWGVLEPYGSGLSEKRMPKLFEISEDKLLRVSHAIMWAIHKDRGYLPCVRCGQYTDELYCRRCAGFPKQSKAGE